MVRDRMPKNQLNMRKGFTPIVFILGIILFLIGLYGLYYSFYVTHLTGFYTAVSLLFVLFGPIFVILSFGD